jgi:pimeloyl-ACP methyl ester carboxylesterase
MGGMISQLLAINYPERVNGLVLGCTTTAMRRGPLPEPEVGEMLTPTPGLTREQQIKKAWPAMCTPGFIQSSVSFLETMLAASLTNPTPLDTIIKQAQAVQSFDSYDRVTTIEAPALVIHGDHDRMIPLSHGQVLAERIPNAELVVLADQGHMFFWEKPDETAKLVTSFLSRIPVSA